MDNSLSNNENKGKILDFYKKYLSGYSPYVLFATDFLLRQYPRMDEVRNNLVNNGNSELFNNLYGSLQLFIEPTAVFFGSYYAQEFLFRFTRKNKGHIKRKIKKIKDRYKKEKYLSYKEKLSLLKNKSITLFLLGLEMRKKANSAAKKILEIAPYDVLGNQAFYESLRYDPENTMDRAIALEKLVDLKNSRSSFLALSSRDYSRSLARISRRLDDSKTSGKMREGLLLDKAQILFNADRNEEAIDSCLQISGNSSDIYSLIAAANIHTAALRDAKYLKPEDRANNNLLWKNILELMKEDKSIRKKFERVAESRNEVLRIHMAGDFFRFKRSLDDNRLFNEYSKHVAIDDLFYWYSLKNNLDFRFFKMAKPLSFYRGDDSKFYFVTKMIDVPMFRDALAGKDLEGKVLNLVRNQAKLHAIATNNLESQDNNFLLKSERERVLLEKYDYRQNLINRFIKRIGDNELGMKFLSNLDDLFSKINGIDTVCHGDSYMENFLADGTALDFENVVVANPTLDLTAILEDPRINFDMGKMLECYVETFNNYSNREIDKGSLETSYVKSRIQNNLCQIGSKLAQGKIQLARDYMIQAYQDLREESSRLKNTKLSDSFIAYMAKSNKIAL